MNILIISIARSGSSQLSKCISTVLELSEHLEPWNYKIDYNNKNKFNFNKNDNIVLKTIVIQSPSGVNSTLDFYQGVYHSFDKVILLSRKNTEQTYESYVHKIMIDDDWHSSWSYQEIPFDEEIFKHIETQKKYITILSRNLNIPITWYEDLYSGERKLVETEIKKWNIDSINYDNTRKFLNPHLKYRKQKIINLI